MHRCAARLGALPHSVTEIDGLDIHFIHVRSPHENALPVIITHGRFSQKRLLEPPQSAVTACPCPQRASSLQPRAIGFVWAEENAMPRRAKHAGRSRQLRVRRVLR
jgi:hypothetical protein